MRTSPNCTLSSASRSETFSRIISNITLLNNAGETDGLSTGVKTSGASLATVLDRTPYELYKASPAQTIVVDEQLNEMQRPQ